MSVMLRAVQESDLPNYVWWLNDPEVAQFMGHEIGVTTLESQQEWYARVSAPDSQKRSWAIEVDDKLIGNCSLSMGTNGQTAGFGILIGDKQAWGKGYGTATTREVVRRGFEEMGLHRISLYAFPENPRGLRCYEKAGFRREGLERQSYFKEGKWRDLVCMAILREEWAQQNEASACGVDEIRIRSYRMADHAQVVAPWEAAGFNLRPSDSEEALTRKLCAGHGVFFLAEAQGKIVGTVMGYVDRASGKVNRVAVHPDHRRKGLARRLMTEVETALAGLGAQRVSLLTHEENAAALALYESLGYRAWRQIVYMDKNIESGVES